MNRFTKINFKVTLPKRMYKGDAGYDCFLTKSITIDSHDTLTIPLGFSVKLNKDECAQIVIRSSKARIGLLASNAIIDSNYSGEVHLILHNLNNFPMTFFAKERLCQIVIFKIAVDKDEEDLPNRSKEDYFGSTGK